MYVSNYWNAWNLEISRPDLTCRDRHSLPGIHFLYTTTYFCLKIFKSQLYCCSIRNVLNPYPAGTESDLAVAFATNIEPGQPAHIGSILLANL